MGGKTKIMISGFKIVACVMIFMHHYLKTINAINEYSYSAILAIATFLFISGYLTNRTKEFSGQWLVRRIVKIQIPYLLVLIPLILLNLAVAGKKINCNTIPMELLGLTIFVNKPFYEGMWFVSLMIGLYLSLFLSNVVSKNQMLLMPIVLSFFYFVLVFSPHVYFLKNEYLVFWLVIYYLGLVIGRINSSKSKQAITESATRVGISHTLTDISKYSLHFYLVHGPVLFLLHNQFRLDKEFTFSVGITFSIVFSLCLSALTKNIEMRVGLNKIIH